MSNDFLSKILNTNSPSGYEYSICEVFCEYLSECCIIRNDIITNSIAIINPEAQFKIMLDAHCDEIGMQVLHIDNYGHISFRKIGAIDTNILPGSEVVIL